MGLALALAACGKPTESTAAKADGVLMRVNDRPITLFDFNLQQLNAGMPKDFSEESQRQVLDALVRAELMYQKGLELGLDQDPGYRNAVALAEAKLAMVKRQEMQKRVYEREITQKVEISDEQAKEYYERHQTEITHEYHLGSLQFPEEKEALAVLERIRNGESFEQVADSVTAETRGIDPSDTENLRRQWDLGHVRWRQIPENIMAVIAKLKEGDVSEPIYHEGSGYIVLKLFEKREVPEADFPSLRAEIKEILRNAALKEREENFYKELKARARIEEVAKPPRPAASAKPDATL